MTILASDIVAQAGTALNDFVHIRWTQAELLIWLNAGRRAAAKLRPDIFAKTSVVKLVAGARQTLPADGHVLFSVNVNMGTSGTAVGDVVYPASRTHLDANQPSWRRATAADAAEGFVYDPSTPLQYLVVPPNTGNGYVEISYGAVPADILVGDAIGCSDIYQTALLDYVLYRAFAKPTDAGSTADKAAAYYGAFRAGLGLETPA